MRSLAAEFSSIVALALHKHSRETKNNLGHDADDSHDKCSNCNTRRGDKCWQIKFEGCNLLVYLYEMRMRKNKKLRKMRRDDA